MKLKVPSLQVTTNTTRSSNDGDELSGKLFADESLKNGECYINVLPPCLGNVQFKNN